MLRSLGGTRQSGPSSVLHLLVIASIENVQTAWIENFKCKKLPGWPVESNIFTNPK